MSPRQPAGADTQHRRSDLTALIESDNAISGDFDDITINGNAMNRTRSLPSWGRKTSMTHTMIWSRR
ncbi:hypothetical protein JT305_21230 [Salmonella enterica subsp. enterica serovar Senftenberg]|nr:hypothetical protein [Salmonella enterica subsp. enterica serovar Senftenberg]